MNFLQGTLADVVTEVRFAGRGLLRSPSYAITVIATLALACGANLAMFGIMDALTYRPLRYLRAQNEVHRVYWLWTDNGQRTTSASTQSDRGRVGPVDPAAPLSHTGT